MNTYSSAPLEKLSFESHSFSKNVQIRIDLIWDSQFSLYKLDHYQKIHDIHFDRFLWSKMIWNLKIKSIVWYGNGISILMLSY